MPSNIKTLISWGSFILSVFLYIRLSYLFNRADFSSLLLYVSLLFFAYFLLYRFSSFSFLKITSFSLHGVLLLSIPCLSQDFYRFFWDGSLINLGLNPYLHTPNELIEYSQIQNKTLLFEKMGDLSAKHFSNYPPIGQILFSVSSYFSLGNTLNFVVLFRLFILSSFIGIYFYGLKILTFYNLNTKNIFLFLLNPLVTIELNGNLHFESIMLLFCLISVFFFIKKKYISSAFFFSLAISTKLLPLIFLPLIFPYTNFKNFITYTCYTIGFTCLFFFPFFNFQFIQNYSSTIGLWFSNFEFNASVFNVVKHLSVKNPIHYYSIFSIVLILISILFFTFKRSISERLNFFSISLFTLFIYFSLASVIHPWYISTLILLCVFSPFKFPLIWSFSIFLSYFAYTSANFSENMSLLFIEYILVFSCFLVEYYLIIIKKRSLF